MECLKGASKPNFMTPKLTHLSPSFSDEDFSVEDLLSFPTDPGFVEENNNSQVYTTNNDDKLTPSVSPVKTVYDGKMTVPETELCFPVTDVEDLEWVSQFVDETLSGDYSVTFPVQKFPEPETETVTLVDVNPAFKNYVHKRARSKRRRTGGSVWSLRSSSPLTDSSTSTSSTSSCTSKPLLVADEILGKPPVQMQIKKRPVQVPVRFASGLGSGLGQSQPRRCSHCLVQKTPQWRTGPLGAKTLCNACGVRFKSGRLLPEYRPACSPTFSSEVHSNNHRKVLEMRREKEAALADDGGLTHLV